MSTPDWQSITRLATTLARDAGAELRRRFGRQVTITLKSTLDPVTDADQAAETLIRQGIQAHWPTHSIQGEEQGETPGTETVRWIVDPLDGTVNYAHGFPQFAVSIAVADAQGVQCGVVYDPMREELFTARRGQAAWLNGVPLAVSHTTLLQGALLATGFPYNRQHNPDNNHREFAALNLLTQGVRRAGSAALDLAYVASGRLDGYWEQHLSPWDVAAGALLVHCAGGTVSTYDGTPHDGVGPQIVASNGHLHAALLAELAQVRQRQA
ncbi:MAG: inositol monophosphatase family protein [Candidatus Tectimicrobiota bacterium]